MSQFNKSLTLTVSVDSNGRYSLLQTHEHKVESGRQENVSHHLKEIYSAKLFCYPQNKESQEKDLTFKVYDEDDCFVIGFRGAIKESSISDKEGLNVFKITIPSNALCYDNKKSEVGTMNIDPKTLKLKTPDCFCFWL